MTTVQSIQNGLPLTLSCDISGQYCAYSVQSTNVTLSGDSFYYLETQYSTDHGTNFNSTPSPIFPVQSNRVSSISLSVLSHYILQTFTWEALNTSQKNIGYSAVFFFDMLKPVAWYELPSSNNGYTDVCGNQIIMNDASGTFITNIINNQFTTNGDGSQGNLFLFLVTLGQLDNTSTLPTQYLYQYNPSTLTLTTPFQISSPTNNYPFYSNPVGLNVSLNTISINNQGICGFQYTKNLTTVIPKLLTYNLATSNKTFLSSISFSTGSTSQTITTQPYCCAITNYPSTSTSNYFIFVNNKFPSNTNTTQVQYCSISTSGSFTLGNPTNYSFTSSTVSPPIYNVNGVTDGTANALVYVNAKNYVYFPVSNYNSSNPSCGFYYTTNFPSITSGSLSEYHIDTSFNYWNNIASGTDASGTNLLYLTSTTNTTATSSAFYKIPLNLPYLSPDISGGFFYTSNTINKVFSYIPTSQNFSQGFNYLNFIMLGAGGQGCFTYDGSNNTTVGAGGAGAGALLLYVPYKYTSTKGSTIITSVSMSPGVCNPEYGKTNTNSIVNIIYNNDPSNNILLTCYSATNTATIIKGGTGGLTPILAYGSNFIAPTTTPVIYNFDVSGNIGSSGTTSKAPNTSITGNPFGKQTFSSGFPGMAYSKVTSGTIPSYKLYSYNSSTSSYSGTTRYITTPSYGGTINETVAAAANLYAANYSPFLSGYGAGGAGIIANKVRNLTTANCLGTNGCIAMYYT